MEVIEFIDSLFFRKATWIWLNRVVEEARLESVYTPKGYPGFESPSLRWKEL